MFLYRDIGFCSSMYGRYITVREIEVLIIIR
jgi:hypothetical protein